MTASNRSEHGASPTRMPPRLTRAAPGLGLLSTYQRSWLRADLLAGVTVAAYLVPQCMAYAELAGLPAVVGLWAVLVPLVVYALVGSSRRLSVGPESTTAIMVAASIGPLAGGDPARYAALAGALAMVVGAVCLVGWAARVGFLANLLSRPVLVGYMAGVAVLMIVGQLGRVTGVDVDGDTVLGEVRDLLGRLDEVHAPTLAVATVVAVGLYLQQRFVPRLPGPLLAVVCSAAAVAVLGLDHADGGRAIEVVGAVPRGLPTPSVPDVGLHDLVRLLGPAVGIAVVGSTDNVLTARAFAARHREDIDTDRELLALGLANAGSGAMGGFAVSSSGSRTALADASGSSTQVYSLVAAACVAVVLLAFGAMLATFPTPALGALVIMAALRLVDRPELTRLRGFRRSEYLLALATLAGVLVFDLLIGVAVAVGLSVAELFTRLMHPHDGVLGTVPGLAGLHDIDDYETATLTPGLVIYRYDAPLVFANAEDFRARALAAVDDIERRVGPVRWFVLNAEANVEVDITGLDALQRVVDELQARGLVVAFARVKQELRDDLERAGVLADVGAARVYPTLPTAVAAFEADSEGRPGDHGPLDRIPGEV